MSLAIHPMPAICASGRARNPKSAILCDRLVGGGQFRFRCDGGLLSASVYAAAVTANGVWHP